MARLLASVLVMSIVQVVLPPFAPPTAAMEPVMNEKAKVQRLTVKMSFSHPRQAYLEDANGQHFMPINLPLEWRIEGTLLLARLSQVNDRADTEQSGPLVELLDVELIRLGVADDAQ